jgi:hypothetical protein
MFDSYTEDPGIFVYKGTLSRSAMPKAASSAPIIL